MSAAEREVSTETFLDRHPVFALEEAARGMCPRGFATPSGEACVPRHRALPKGVTQPRPAGSRAPGGRAPRSPQPSGTRGRAAADQDGRHRGPGFD